MFWFWKKEKSLDDIFVETLQNSDIEWTIKISDITDAVVYVQWGGFVFMARWDKYTQDGRSISRNLFWKVKEVAEESIRYSDIQKAGGYILDDDLRECIANAKKVLVAWKQIEMLTDVIENIRSKY